MFEQARRRLDVGFVEELDGLDEGLGGLGNLRRPIGNGLVLTAEAEKRETSGER